MLNLKDLGVIGVSEIDRFFEVLDSALTEIWAEIEREVNGIKKITSTLFTYSQNLKTLKDFEGEI